MPEKEIDHSDVVLVGAGAHTPRPIVERDGLLVIEGDAGADSPAELVGPDMPETPVLPRTRAEFEAQVKAAVDGVIGNAEGVRPVCERTAKAIADVLYGNDEA